MTYQYENQDTRRAGALLPVLQARKERAARLRTFIAEFTHELSMNFAIQEINLIVNQLMVHSQGNSGRYRENMNLMKQDCIDIVRQYHITMLPTMREIHV